jgi:hypothetical protein
MVLEPLMQVKLGVSLHEFVGAADPQKHQHVQVVGVDLIRCLESADSEIVLVVLLVKLA